MRFIALAWVPAVAIVAAGCLGHRGRDISLKGSGVQTKQLEVLYFDGCPNTPPIFDSVQEAVQQLGAGWDVVKIDLEGLPEDDLRRGYGSPTILLDGHDLFGEPRPATPTLSCRNYRDGIPTSLLIVHAVRRRTVESE